MTFFVFEIIKSNILYKNKESKRGIFHKKFR